MPRDITQRKEAERTTGLLAAIVDSSDDAIISKSLDGVISSWNKGAERMFGYTADEAIGQHITLIIPPDRRQEEAMILERLKRGERVDHFETVARAQRWHATRYFTDNFTGERWRRPSNRSLESSAGHYRAKTG